MSKTRKSGVHVKAGCDCIHLNPKNALNIISENHNYVTFARHQFLQKLRISELIFQSVLGFLLKYVNNKL